MTVGPTVLVNNGFRDIFLLFLEQLGFVVWNVSLQVNNEAVMGWTWCRLQDDGTWGYA